ncbi:uncharacterized protein [Argopecten irradians]|uniref:uncharacterized protein n=1 Tax=Argopecten irradians TaxID=31199 RepID=UPI00370F7E48
MACDYGQTGHRGKQIKNAWDSTRSVKENMQQMGLATDPNKTLKIPKTKDSFVTSIPGSSKKTAEKQEVTPVKQHVALELEAEANIPQKRRLRLSEPETRYCIYMMEKYGEDYKAMARDLKNYYQDTPKQIKNKIKAFKSVPEQYGEYLKQKGMTDVWLAGGSTPPPRTIDMGVVRKHDTRKRRAKRRNGHYTTPPGRVPTPVRNSAAKSEAIPWHKVKRKLHFGRVPPRSRSNSSSKPATTSKAPKRDVAARSGLTRELNCLLNMTSAYVVPVRLRSSFKTWGQCHVETPKNRGSKLHPSPELTNLKITEKDSTHTQIARSLRLFRRNQTDGYRVHASHEQTSLVKALDRGRQRGR